MTTHLGACGQDEAKVALMALGIWKPFLANDNKAVRGTLAGSWAHDYEEALHILQAVGLFHHNTWPMPPN